MTYEPPPPCTRPTIYLVGAITKQSSITKDNLRWAEILGIEADIRGAGMGKDSPGSPLRPS